MLKAILLGHWHSLSDAALEQVLCVRIDFLHFCGLSLSDAIPYETTLCRFRNRLVINDRLDGLLAIINEQIQSHGLMVKGTTGAVIDATLIESAARPKKTITLEVDAEGKTVQFEAGSQPRITCTEEQSTDADGAKKGSSPPQCSIRVKNSLEKGLKLHFCVKKRAKVSFGNFSPPPQQNYQGYAEVHKSKKYF